MGNNQDLQGNNVSQCTVLQSEEERRLWRVWIYAVAGGPLGEAAQLQLYLPASITLCKRRPGAILLQHLLLHYVFVHNVIF